MDNHSVTMSGTSYFYSFAYMRLIAQTAAQAAKEKVEGSNHQRIVAVVFSAFALEAHFNHIGEETIPFWEIVEPKLSWKAKLDLLAQQMNLTPDFGKRPYQTVKSLFTFRDKIAHGKTWQKQSEFDFPDPRAIPNASDPEWLTDWCTDEKVARALEDSDAVILEIHQKAGFHPLTISTTNEGRFVARFETKGKRVE